MGYFWNVLETDSLTKIAQILDNFLAILETSLLRKNCFGYFLGNFGEDLATFWATLVMIWLPLNLASGHTGSHIDVETKKRK